MRLLFVLTPAFNPNDGGVQRTTFKLGKRFTELGYTVHYYSASLDGHVEALHGTLHAAIEQGGLKNKANLLHLRKVIGEIQPHFVINQMPYERPLRSLLGELKAQHGYYLLGCLRNSLFAFKSNVEDILKRELPRGLFHLVNHKLGIGIVQYWHKRKHGRELKEIIVTHDRFILLAPPNRKELDYFIGEYKSEKVIAIPNSIPDIYPDAIDQKEKIILHVGRLNIPQKRSDLLLDFWASCHKKLKDWKFVIVGDGPYREELEKDLQRRGLPRVMLEGYQKPEPYYKKASIFMMPSAYEGFPNTILEAQSYGCASIAFNSYPALDWIVNDGIDAKLIEAYDTKAMAEAVADLARNPKKLEELQQAAILNAERFTIEHVGYYWKDLFDHMHTFVEY